MIEIKTKQELHEVIETNPNDGLIVVKFSAPWCGPCRQMEKTIENIEANENNRVKFYNVDVDELQELADEYEIMSIPVLLFFKGSLQVDKTLGGIPESKLIEKIEENNNK